MPRRLTASLVLAVAVASCSKTDERAASNGAHQQSLLRPAIGAPENDGAQMPGAEPTLSIDKVAAATEPKASEKQKQASADKPSKRAQTAAARRWGVFQTAMEKCLAVPLTDRERCLAEGRDHFRSVKIDCAALPGAKRKECLKYSKLWKDTEVDVPTASITGDAQPGVTATTLEDQRPAELILDSTEPSQDTPRSAEDQTKAN